MIQRQSGFTLVEIAVVLVIIGLLLGGVLKGQELIASARVRNLADQQSGIQAAYYGFNDRYRAVSGDMEATPAAQAIGDSTITCGGDGSGQLEAPGAWEELNAVWVHLSKAGFIKGSYGCDNTTSEPAQDDGPVNVFNGNLIMAYHNGYTGNNPPRLLIHMGRNVPANIARELDVKLDDGQPDTGILRNSADGTAGYHSDASCVDSSVTPAIWDVETNFQNCNPAYLF